MFATIIILIVLIVLVALVVFSLIRKQKTGCGNQCANCSSSDICSKKKI